MNGAHESNFVAAGDIRRRLSESLKGENKSRKNLKRDPDDPSAAVLKEPWTAKVHTVWKFQDFSVTYFLREIDFVNSRKSEKAVFAHF